ncbi:hypothetical protein BW14_06925 [Bifidobacterium sp. UTBIF-68]|uniref:hypothetical protein n=1 Tax=Bifidobacterium sp. UTBIF-68 TaxID=1465262 RepID=UPI00112D81E5|nr:hypothetical protein [Bifidobacterium sp. UTBIF-68]TPF92890.1 hypothetical protein BW14_06925 [Bifidobacterium sp. UTBIF-68]
MKKKMIRVSDPTRKLTAVTGLWVRLRGDMRTYDIRFVNHSTKRIWRLGQTSTHTCWSVTARGKDYEPMLAHMRETSTDLEHGWMLVPDSEWENFGFHVPIPFGLTAKKVADIKLCDLDRGWTQVGEKFTANTLYPLPVDTRYADLPELDEDSFDAVAEDYGPTAEEWAEYLADVYADAEPVEPVEPAPVTTEIPEIPPKVNSKAVSYATLPDLMPAKDCPELQGLGRARVFRTANGRKAAYVASADGKCVVAYRARYERGSDKKLEKELADYARRLGFEVAA